MDYLALAASIVTTALIPIFKTLGTKALEEVGKKTGEEVFDKRQTILEKVKDLFAGDELTTLNLLAENPDDGENRGEIKGKLEEKLKANPEVAKELEGLMKSIPSFQVKQNTLTQTGSNHTGFQDITGSTININIPKACDTVKDE